MMTQHQDPGSGARKSLRFRIALRSDVGKVRSENQDYGLVSSPAEWNPADGILMIVADGMGGHRGGATASRLAASTILSAFLEARDSETGGALVTAIQRANERVFSESKSNQDLRGMGTTASALAVRNDRGWIGHVGDSRIYRLRSGELTQLTEDHSLVATMVKEGLITPEEAAVHPRRNVLQRSLGVASDIEIDHQDGFELLPGDIYLLCSDGLHGFVSLEKIRDALALPVEGAAERCIELAHDAGAPDNVTVLICAVEGGSPEDHDPLPQRTIERPAEPAPVGERAEPPLAFRWLWVGFLLGAVGALAWLWTDLRSVLGNPVH